MSTWHGGSFFEGTDTSFDLRSLMEAALAHKSGSQSTCLRVREIREPRKCRVRLEPAPDSCRVPVLAQSLVLMHIGCMPQKRTPNGELLKSLRGLDNLTQEGLAEKAGVNVRTIQRLEGGKHVDEHTLSDIAAAIGVDARRLDTENGRWGSSLFQRITAMSAWERVEEAARQAVTTAGIAAMGFYGRDTESYGGSASTSRNPAHPADFAATAALLRSIDAFLTPLAGELGCGLSYLAEESVEEHDLRLLSVQLGEKLMKKVHREDQFFANRTNIIRVVIDGIDGTKNFGSRIPIFCSAVAVLIDEHPCLSAVYDPIHNVVYSGVLAETADGRFRNQATLWQVASGAREDLTARRNRRPDPLRGQSVGVHFVRSSDEALAELLRHLPALAAASASLYALNSGLWAMALVSAGALGCFLNPSTNPWDVAAGQVLVEACGGRVTDFAGQPISYRRAGRISVASCSAALLHEEVLRLLAERGSGGSAIGGGL